MSMFAWTLMSLIAYLKSLLRKSSTDLSSQAIVTPCMCKDLVILEPLSKIQICRSTYKVISYVDFVPYV